MLPGLCLSKIPAPCAWCRLLSRFSRPPCVKRSPFHVYLCCLFLRKCMSAVGVADQTLCASSTPLLRVAAPDFRGKYPCFPSQCHLVPQWTNAHQILLAPHQNCLVDSKHCGQITPKGSGGFLLAHLYFNIRNGSFKEKSFQGSKPSFKQAFLPNSSCCIVANAPRCFPKTT